MCVCVCVCVCVCGGKKDHDYTANLQPDQSIGMKNSGHEKVSVPSERRTLCEHHDHGPEWISVQRSR